MIVYIDVIWLLNFIVDGMLLLLTAYILKRKWYWYRIVFGALIASSIVFISISSYAEIILQPIGKMIFSIFIILITFGFVRLKLFIKTLFIFYFATFMVGGGIVGLHYLFSNQGENIITNKLMAFGDPISWLFVIFMLPIVIYYSKKQIEEIEVRKVHYTDLVTVEIELCGEKIILKGLIDSGNSLCDPLTQVPVMILDISVLKSIIPNWLFEKSRMMNNFTFSKKEEEHPIFSKIRLIPYKVVGSDNQLLLAIKSDNLKIIQSNHEMKITKVLIGLSHTKLSSNNEFDCLLHPKMLQNTSMFSA